MASRQVGACRIWHYASSNRLVQCADFLHALPLSRQRARTEREMKAVVFHEHGALDNLKYEDFPDPQPGEREILIRVRAVALNGFDPMVLRGIPGLKTPLPMIPGADITGEIVELGSMVDGSRFKIGDRVTVIPNQPTGMMGETKRGGCSELVAVEQ